MHLITLYKVVCFPARVSLSKTRVRNKHFSSSKILSRSMHGVKKVNITEEEKDAKTKERAKKLQIYTKVRDAIFEKIKNDSYDGEGLNATGQLLSKNPDIYTFWNYRKKALTNFLSEKKSKENTTEFDEFSSGLESRFHRELELTETCLSKNPKSYGAWHHRGWVLQRMEKPDYLREIKECERALTLDERNFHCWDHWRVVCKLGNVSLEDQAKFSDKKVVENFSNYSAWHYRSKLLPVLYPDPNGVMQISCDKFLQELALLHNAFFTDPDDQSCWFYRNWLFTRIPSAKTDAKLTDEEIRCLEFDLKQMSALAEMEPDKKWPLLTKVLAMKSLNFEKYERDIFDGLELLKTIDSPRKLFYDHLSTSWRLEKT